MDNATNSPSLLNADRSTTRSLARWTALAGMLALGSVAVAVRLRGAFGKPPQLLETGERSTLPAQMPAQVAQAASAETPDDKSVLARRWFRWLLFVEVIIGITWVLLAVPPYTRPLLGGLLVAAIAGAVISRWRLMPTIRLREALARFTRVEQSVLARMLTLTALALVIASAYLLRPQSAFDVLPAAVLLMLLGWLALAVAIPGAALAGIASPADRRDFSAARYNRLHRWLLGAGVVLLLLVIEINGDFLKVELLQQVNSHVQYVLLCLCFLCLILGLGAVGAGQRKDATQRPQSSEGRKGINISAFVALPLTLLALGLFALVLRLWQLDDTVRFFVDELTFATAMRRFRYFDDTRLLIPMDGIAAFPNLYVYWQWLGERLFGRNFYGLRAASAMIGTLTVLAQYLLARTLFDRRTALVAAVLLATFPPHLHFSRLGLNNIADPLFGVLALAFLARGVKHNSRLDYACGGALLGLTHYFYEGGRLFYTPLAVTWLVLLAIIWRPRVAWRNLLVAGATCVLVALPIYTTLLSVERSFAPRIVEQHTGLAPEYWQWVLLSQGGMRWHIQDHVLPSLLAYIHRVDSTLFYKGADALVLAAVFPAALLGAGWALRGWLRPGLLLLILWILAASAGNSLMVDSGASTRFVIVYPALMLLVAVGIRYTVSLLITSERWQTRLITWLMVIFAALHVFYYFHLHLPLYNRQFRVDWGHRDGQDAVLRSLDFPAGTRIYIIGQHRTPDQQFTSGVLGYMNEELHVYTLLREDFTPEYIEGMPAGADYAFYIEPNDSETLALLRQHFSLLPPQQSPFDLPLVTQYVLYYAPQPTLRAAS